MNTTYQFDNVIVDFYRDFNGTLEFISTRTVIENSLHIIVDTVTPQKSKLSVEDVEELSVGDYGILRTRNGNVVFYIRDVNRKRNENDVEISFSSGMELLTHKYICSAASQIGYKSPAFVRIPDLVDVFNGSLTYQEETARIKVPYIFFGYTGEVTVEFGQSGWKEVGQIFREKSRTDNINVSFNIIKKYTTEEYVDSSAYFIRVDVSKDNDEELILDLDDTSVFVDYTVDFSDMSFNVLLYAIASEKLEYLRVDVNGDIQKPLNSNGTVNNLWEKNAIYPQIVETVVVDPTSTNATSIEAARAKLLEQYYSSNVEVIIKIDNNKIDLSNLDALFHKKFILWKNGKSFKTICTRYEVKNDGFVTLKFGNARGRLTEKIQKIIKK